MAVTPVEPDRWQFSVGPYLWMAGVKSTVGFTSVRSGSTINANVDADFGKILGDLNFAFMTDAEARRGADVAAERPESVRTGRTL